MATMLRATAVAVAMLGAAALAPPDLFQPISDQHPVELHHSLHHPLDRSQVYWNFGGSTVLTRNFIRLTPNTQDRKGWLWNEYPLESENWEIYFEMEVASKPHFGGDGMAFWILAGDQDPTFNREPDFLNGPVFGMKNDFQGIGVVFDVYDNDNKRNNPSVFVLDNPKEGTTHYNHDNDYEDDMVKTTPASVPGHEKDPNVYTSHKCVVDLRNTGKSTKVLVRFLHKVLHVYMDAQQGQGWKFCLAVELDRDFIDHHMAFTAATGQVADKHDIRMVEARYLPDSEKEIDDAAMDHWAESGEAQTASVFWVIMVMCGLVVLAAGGYELSQLRLMLKQQIDAVRICHQLNPLVQPQILAFGGVCALLLFSGNWLALGMHMPLLVWRLYDSANRQHLYTPASMTGVEHKGHGSKSGCMDHTTKLMIRVAYTVLLQVYYFYRLSR